MAAGEHSTVIGFERLATSREAAQRTTVLARAFATPVQVVRSPDSSGWMVQQPWNYREELDPAASWIQSPIDIDYEDGEPLPPLLPKEIQQEIDQERQVPSEEMKEARENWTRADEDGWLYPD